MHICSTTLDVWRIMYDLPPSHNPTMQVQKWSKDGRPNQKGSVDVLKAATSASCLVTAFGNHVHKQKLAAAIRSAHWLQMSAERGKQRWWGTMVMIMYRAHGCSGKRKFALLRTKKHPSLGSGYRPLFFFSSTTFSADKLKSIYSICCFGKGSSSLVCCKLAYALRQSRCKRKQEII